VHSDKLLWKNALLLHVAGDEGIGKTVIAIALNFRLVCELHIEAVVLHRIWLFPVESRVGNRDNLYVRERFANAANFVCGGWNMDRIAFFGNLELLHIFSIYDMILSEVVTWSDDTNNDSLELMLLGGIFLFFENARNISNCLIEVFNCGLDVLFIAFVVFQGADNFLANIFKVKLR